MKMQQFELLNAPPPIFPVVLTDLRLFNKLVPTGKEIGDGTTLTKIITQIETILLSHKDYIFSFQFAALNHISPGKNRFAYMMAGFDRDCNYAAGRNYATYINLPACEYRFRLNGYNNDTVWNVWGTSVKLIIIPPFWRAWWFRITVRGD